MHAREWIGPATNTYILNQLLTSTDPSIQEIAKNYNWYIFPVANPDGYEYTHTTVGQAKLLIDKIRWALIKRDLWWLTDEWNLIQYLALFFNRTVTGEKPAQ